MTTKADVARIAREVCAEFSSGNRGLLHYGQVTINLRDTAMCARFVREVHESALQSAEYTWAWRGANAREVEWLLRRAGKRIDKADAEPGDIVAFNWHTSCAWGHIGLWKGGEHDEYWENTSSTSRGPGFVTSRLTQIGWNRVSGFYSVLPSALKPFRVNYLGTYLEPEDAELRDGHTWVQLGAALAVEDYVSSLPKRHPGRHMVWRPELRKVFVKTGHVEDAREEGEDE